MKNIRYVIVIELFNDFSHSFRRSVRKRRVTQFVG